LLLLAVGKWTISSNLSLPLSRIIDVIERTGLCELGKGVRHLPTSFFLRGGFFQYSDPYAKRAICGGGLSSPPETVSFENAFIRLKHGSPRALS